MPSEGNAQAQDGFSDTNTDDPSHLLKGLVCQSRVLRSKVLILQDGVFGVKAKPLQANRGKDLLFILCQVFFTGFPSVFEAFSLAWKVHPSR